jgi:uncharacterized protein
MLEQKLVTFNRQTSNQITVVVVQDLGGMAPQQFAYKIGEEWKVGQKEFDNGIVVLVKPKQNRVKGQAFIATGYGLEGAVPDATAKRIVEHEMIPAFKKNQYATGINNALNVLIEITQGEYTAQDYQKKTNDGGGWVALVPFLAIVITIILMNRRYKDSYSSYGGHRRSGDGLLAALFFGSMLSGSHSGKWNDFSSGGGSFGGGGGFGGFGGGSFGGGGAGGSW